MAINLLNKSAINNFDKIVDAILREPLNEHLGDVMYLLDRFDKKRDPEDPELKQAVLTVVNEILVKGIAPPIFGYSPTGPMPDPIPNTTEEVLEYLDRYWGEPNDHPHNDIGRAYLIFFGLRKAN